MGRYATTWFQTQMAANNAPGELRVWVGRRRFDDAWRQCPKEEWRPLLLQAMGLWGIPAVVKARDAFNTRLNEAIAPTVQGGLESATIGEAMFDVAMEERRRKLLVARRAYESAVASAEANFHAAVAEIAPRVKQITEDDASFADARREAEVAFYAELVAALPPIHNPYWVVTVSKTDPKGYIFFEEGGPWSVQKDRH